MSGCVFMIFHGTDYFVIFKKVNADLFANLDCKVMTTNIKNIPYLKAYIFHFCLAK